MHVQGAQLEPLLGSARFVAVVAELLISSHVIMVSKAVQTTAFACQQSAASSLHAKPGLEVLHLLL